MNLSSDLTGIEATSRPVETSTRPVIKPLQGVSSQPLGVSTVPPPEILSDNAVHDDGESLEVYIETCFCFFADKQCALA